MRYTFKSDECMVITIPLGSLRDSEEGQLMPENFSCVFKDAYKVFLKGQPKALGAAQLVAGVLIVSLALLLLDKDLSLQDRLHLLYSIPSVLFVFSGMVTYAAGYSPNMCVIKLSFVLNIISFFWSISAVFLCSVHLYHHYVGDRKEVMAGIKGMIVALLAIEMVVAVVLIYWESKAVCRQHFNILPMIILKQEIDN